MDKITMEVALKMEKSGFVIMHVDWFTYETGYSIIHNIDLRAENPDCSHVLIDPVKRWRQAGAVAALILSE